MTSFAGCESVRRQVEHDVRAGTEPGRRRRPVDEVDEVAVGEPEVDRSQRIERRPVHRPLDDVGQRSQAALATRLPGRRPDPHAQACSGRLGHPVDDARGGGGHHEVVDGGDDAER